MEDMLRSATASSGSKDSETLKQADSIWRMLDQMAESDPDNYQKFIDKHLSQGKEYFQMPEPFAVAVTHTLKPNGKVDRRVFINMFSWNRVPAPHSFEDNSPIPMTGAQCTEGTPKDTYVCCVSFALKTLEELSKKRMDEGFGVLIHLSMRYLQQNCGVPKMTLNFKILDGEKFGGSGVNNLRKALMESEDAVAAREGISQMSAQLQNARPDEKGEIFKRLSASARARGSPSSPPSTMASDAAPEIRIPGTEPKDAKPTKKLVQELKPGDRPLKRPVHVVEKVRKKNAAGVMETVLQVSMALPQLPSTSELEVDVGEDDVSVFVPDLYATEILLPDRVDRESAKAVFSKKSTMLRLRLPLLQAAA